MWLIPIARPHCCLVGIQIVTCARDCEFQHCERTQVSPNDGCFRIGKVVDTRYSGVVNMDVQYTYSATQNNGQITQSQDNVTGEQVTYQYDSLQRLVSAATVGPQWGLAFTYDGFGNRRSQQVTKGTAPAVYASYDSATNRINGYIHDGNGNITWLPNGTTLAYDVENRVKTATVGGTVETYYYAPDGKRVYRKAADGTETMYFYGVKGERLPYQIGPYAGQLTGTPPVSYRSDVVCDRLERYPNPPGTADPGSGRR